jgi:hypothetical protein
MEEPEMGQDLPMEETDREAQEQALMKNIQALMSRLSDPCAREFEQALQANVSAGRWAWTDVRIVGSRDNRPDC